MSLRQYARHRHVALNSVQKAIRAQRIETLPDGRVDSAEADAAWRRNTRVYTTALTGQHQPDAERGAAADQYASARAVREHYEARLAKIEYEERTGRLVSKDEVQIAAFNRFRQFRDAMLNLPDRLAAQLAAESEEAKCYEILSNEVRRALNEFAGSGK